MSNDAQIDYWNGRAGEKWRAMQDDLDAMLAPVTAALMERVGDVAGQAVLDVGCGTGQTCVLLMDKGAVVTGVDVSEPMLALAGERTGARGAASGGCVCLARRCAVRYGLFALWRDVL